MKNENKIQFKSRKEATAFLGEKGIDTSTWTNLQWLKLNKGQADIHMMFLAEAIYDAINESTPKELKEGEWHIPYGNNRDEKTLSTMWLFDTNSKIQLEEKAILDLKCKISIARCARLSYQTLGDNPVIDYEADLKLYDVLSKSGHWSPFEHVALVMDDDQYHYYVKTMPRHGGVYTERGWCRNFKGFVQYRELLD
jgi:hypothetical protein